MSLQGPAWDKGLALGGFFVGNGPSWDKVWPWQGNNLLSRNV